MITSELINKTTFSKEEIYRLLTISELEFRKQIDSTSEMFPNQAPKDFHFNEETIELSNYCEANCCFCQARNENNKLHRFRLNREEIINEALKLSKMGYKSIMLHSGYDRFYNVDRISYIIYSIKKSADVKITLSFGLRQFNEYKAWKIAGADSYFLNFVTSNKTLYDESQSWGCFEDRLEHLNELKGLGYNVGSGSIIGLPKQSAKDLVNDIFLCKDLDIDYVEFCHYNFAKLRVNNLNNDDFIRRGIEIAKMIMPDRNIRLNNLIN